MGFMEGLLDIIASTENGFAEMADGILDVDFEARKHLPLAIRKGYIVRSHARKVMRYRPNHKGLGLHTRSEHRSHGRGSFCRTHDHPTCR